MQLIKSIIKFSGSDAGYVWVSDFIYDDDSNSYVEVNKYAIPYFDRSTLFGAIITDNPDTYLCVLKTALERYRLLLKEYGRNYKAI